MFGGRLNRLTASLIRRIRAKFLAQITGGKMFCPMKENNAPVFITSPFEPEINLKDFGLGVDCIIKVTPKGAKNTEQANQPDSGE